MIGVDPEVRLFGEGDDERLARMVGRLSPNTMYRRFFAAHPTLSAEMLRALSAVDHERHEAVVALVGGEMIGLASYHRNDDDPGEAEIAVMVEDAWQHHGVGGRLTRRLARLARDRGLASFHATVLADNQDAVRLIRHSNPSTTAAFDHGQLSYELPLRRRPQALADLPIGA